MAKVDNIEWSDADNQFFHDRLNGRTMESLDFDPTVDAVAQATMSSAIIFDEVRRSVALLEHLRNM